jgi:hypothetical protein
VSAFEEHLALFAQLLEDNYTTEGALIVAFDVHPGCPPNLVHRWADEVLGELFARGYKEGDAA